MCSKTKVIETRLSCFLISTETPQPNIQPLRTSVQTKPGRQIASRAQPSNIPWLNGLLKDGANQHLFSEIQVIFLP